MQYQIPALPLPLHTHITRQLDPLYGPSEAALMAEMVLEKITGQQRPAIRNLMPANLSPAQQLLVEECLQQLLQYRPIQYVLHEAWFQNMPFFVDERVLIPRPETEELVEWVAKDALPKKAITILDIGSGSGCIPISLAKKLPLALIHSCEISAGALSVAQKNAADLQATVQWHLLDFLNAQNWPLLPCPDIIVSNPPYIPQSGRAEMAKHVVDFEPENALFVPNDNALLFYQAIADFVRQYGKPGTNIYVEIHEDLAAEVCRVFADAKLSQIEIRRDMQGKERMVKAVLLGPVLIHGQH